MAGSFNIFYMSQEPLYTKEELLAINDTIQNSNTTKPEPEKYGAVQADKKSKVSLVLWLEIKKYLEKLEDFIYDANDNFFIMTYLIFQIFIM